MNQQQCDHHEHGEHCHHHDHPDAEIQNRLVKHARFYEYFTVGWNVCEGALSLFFAVIAGSSVLYGFGIDACIEASSGLILLWRLQAGSLGESREKTARILVGISLLILAIYVLIDSARHLYYQENPKYLSPVSW